MFEDNRSPVQLSTQCPHCQTPLQADVGALQRSKGWARCGRCHYLFDAVAHTGIPTLAPVSGGFADDTPTATPQAPGMRQAVVETGHERVQPSAPDPEPATVEQTEQTALPRSQAEVVQQQQRELGSEVLPAERQHDLSARDGHVAVPSSWQTLSKAMDDALLNKAEPPEHSNEPSLDMQASGDSTVRDSLSQMYDQAAQEANTSTPSDQDLLGSPADVPQMVDQPASFYSDDTSGVGPSERSGISLRWLMWIAVFFLLLLLGAQLAYFQRDWLVARVPQVRPVAQQICQQMGCTIGAIQDMRHMRILSSSVMRLDNGELQLDITLENKGNYQLDVPNIDVLLTDGSDQVFMSHQVKPSDWPQVLERLDANSRYPLTVRWPSNDDDAARMVGYRTQLSYD